MKTKLLLLLLIAGGFASAQTPPGYTKINSRYDWLAVMADSGLHVPRFCGFPVTKAGVASRAGEIGVDTCNNVLYFRGTAGWVAAGSTDGIDSLRRVGLNVQARKNGVWTTQFTDSVGISRAELADSSAAIRADFPSGGQTVEIFAYPVIGSIYEDTSWSNLLDFRDTTGFSVDGNGHIVAAADASLTRIIKLKDYTMLDRDSITVKFIWNSTGTNDYGASIGFTSANSTVASSIVGTINLQTAGADYGKLVIYDSYTTTNYVAPTAAFSSTAVGDTITLTLSNNNGLWTVYATNHTTGVSSSFSVQNSFTFGGTELGHNTARVSFQPTNGQYTILSIKHASMQGYRPNKLFVGNSLSAGSFAGSAANRYAILQGGDISAGGGDKTADVLLHVPEIINVIKPNTVYLEVGANDIFQSVSSGTWQANYASIVSQLEAAGINVIKLVPAPSNAANLTPLRTWIIANHPTTYIDLFIPMLGTGTGLNPIYDAGDGTHWNALGNRKVDTLINQSGISFPPKYYIDQYIAGNNVTLTPTIINGARVQKIDVAATGSSSSTPVTVPGSNTQIIYNNSGAFGASANMTWDGNKMVLKRGSTGNALEILNSSNQKLLEIGELAGAGSNFLMLSRFDNSKQVQFVWNPSGSLSSSNVNWSFGMNGSTNAVSMTSFDGATPVEVLTIGNNGNVGIGVTSPSYKLHVNGYMAAGAPAYSSGGFDMLVRNTSGRFETIFGTESTYTPTLTNTTNVAASTAYVTHYQQIGNTIRVWGEISIDATTALTTTELGISLPVASALTTTQDLSGHITFEDNTTMQIKADVANGRAVVRGMPQTATNNRYSFTFTYKYFAP